MMTIMYLETNVSPEIAASLVMAINALKLKSNKTEYRITMF
jgi:hypothetical protein